MSSQHGLQQLFGDLFEAFFDGFNSTTSPYGADGKLDESDIDIRKLFALFKNSDSLIEQFVTYNKKHYCQTYTSSGELINAFYQSLGQTATLHTKTFKEIQFAYLFGIPVLVVKSLPWDDPDDDIRFLGNYNGTGIVCAEHNGIIATVEHEIMHAVVAWLQTGGVFKLRAKSSSGSKKKRRSDDLASILIELQELIILKQTSIPDRIALRLRDETIAYLTANPGELASRDKLLVIRSLTGRGQKELMTLLPNSFNQLSGLIDYIMTVDSGTHSMSRTKICQIMMSCVSIQEIVVAINEANRA